jgi:hyperosmotically inducible protein
MNSKLLFSLLVASLVLSTQSFANIMHQDNNDSDVAVTTNGTTSSANESAPNNAHDTAITTGVKNAISNNASLQGQTIDVTTQNGVVTLKGTVDSDSQATSAVEMAQSIVGVKDVETTDLNVKDSQQPMTDAYITAKVKGILIREKLFGDKDIAALGMSVETKDGVVYLTGHIDNKAQVKNAIKVLEGVTGVKKVVYDVKKITPAS